MANELECSVVINFLLPIPISQIYILFMSLLLSLPVFSKELVLVSSITVNYQPLSLFEVRKIFLGYPIKRENTPLIAIRNKSDEESYQIFLQKVIHLSARNYERRLMSKTFRTGTPTVLAVDSLLALKYKLLNNEFNVSVMWLEDVELDSKLKVLQTLWKESN